MLGVAMLGCGGGGAPAGTSGSPGGSGGTTSGSPGGSSGGGSPATTTLQAEIGNDTSASDSFAGQTNGIPKPRNVSKVDTHALLYSGATTKIYAHLLGWFGNSGHMNVGYTSSDPAQVGRQVTDMISRGLNGAILDWYGPNEPTVNGTALALRTAAEAHPGFEFAIMEDVGSLFDAAKANGCDVTTQLLNDLTYINTQFAPSPAYMKVSGRPVILFFGVDAYYIDWQQVRSQVTNNPLLLFRDADGLTRPISDGAFQWEDISADAFHPASPNPFDPQLGSQDAFYQANQNGRFEIGSVYRGFNDSLAPWGIDRFVQPRCGQTWLDTFSEINKFYSANRQLPALQMVSWNDYDEGTAVETGIDNCVYLQPSVSGTTLSWQVGGGPESTVDHYTVFSSTDGQNLSKLADVPAGTHSVDLSTFNLGAGTVSLLVKATGKPSIQNKMSSPVAFHAGDQPPAVKLALSQTGTLSYNVSTAGSSDPDGSVASSTIDFGDGTVVAGPSASHTYAAVGTYDVKATVVDNAGASAVAVQRISAKAGGAGVIILSPSSGAVVNGPTPTFVATASGGAPIQQMKVLVDGTQVYATDRDYINTALKIYKGNHQVVVQAVDNTGTVTSAAVNVTAEPNDAPPTPALQVTALPQVGANTLLLCGANWQDPDGFVNAFHWTFSDGGQAFTPGVVHTFPGPGSFSATEDVIDQFGAPGSLTQNVNASQAANVSATSKAVQAPAAQKPVEPMRRARY